MAKLTKAEARLKREANIFDMVVADVYVPACARDASLEARAAMGRTIRYIAEELAGAYATGAQAELEYQQAQELEDKDDEVVLDKN